MLVPSDSSDEADFKLDVISDLHLATKKENFVIFL